MRSGEPAGYLGLVGIDMQDAPGTYELAVAVKHGEEVKHLSFNVLVAKEKFSVEHLKLPEDKVDLDDKSLARWKMEQEQLRQALAENSALRMWHSQFRRTGQRQAHGNLRQCPDHERPAEEPTQRRRYRGTAWDGCRCHE